MTTFKLRIIFTGICIFVKHKSKPRAKVLLVDGRPHADGLMHVSPVVRFNRRDLDPANTRQPDICRDGVAGLLMGDSLCFLDRDDVTIKGDKPFKTPLLFTTGKKSSMQQEPTIADRDDMGWVADLERISTGAGKSQKWWFDPRPVVKEGDPQSPLVARVDLESGLLATWDFMRSYKGAGPGVMTPPDVYELNSSYRQALASFVSCSIECDEGTKIALSTTSWENGAATKTLTFAPLRSELRIEIWNTPFFDILQSFFPDEPAQWSYRFGSGETFKHHYNAQQPPKPGPYPNPNNHSFASSQLLQYSVTKGAGCGPGGASEYEY